MAEKVVIGNAELWHGDCREVLPTLPAHDLLLTDPPYGTRGKSDKATTNHYSPTRGFFSWYTATQQVRI